MEAACALILKGIKARYVRREWKNTGAHLEIVGALGKFLRDEQLSSVDKEMIDLLNMGELIEYWKTQPKYKQKMRHWWELFLMNQTDGFKNNKAGYQMALADLNRMDRTGNLASLFVARHPIFMLYLGFFLGPYMTNALYTQPLSDDEADELLKTPVPDDQIEYVFYPKHVGMRVRDQFFDIGNRKPSKLESAPERPRLDGATFVRVQGDPGLARRVLTRFNNYPEGKFRIYQEWNSTCISNANDLIQDETGLYVPGLVSSYPSATEGYLKTRKLFGSARIVQIKTIAPDQQLRKVRNATTSTSWLYRTSKYSVETLPFLLDLAILDGIHDCAEVNFPKEKQSQ